MLTILKLLEENARYTVEEMAVMLSRTETEVEQDMKALEQKGIIRGYKALVDKQKLPDDSVMALIELKVTPKRDYGFDEIAKRIAQYPEVEDLYLMSGGYDLALILRGKTFKDIALFVSQRLALLDSVVSTATHFVLSQYKQMGILMNGAPADERRNALL